MIPYRKVTILGFSSLGDDLQQIFADVSSSEDEGQDINVEDDEGTRDSIDMMTDIQSQELTQQEEDAGSKVIEADEENSQEQCKSSKRQPDTGKVQGRGGGFFTFRSGRRRPLLWVYIPFF